MKILKQNIIDIYGENGKRWIDTLPGIVNELSDQWGLAHITPVDNMSFNYVVKAIAPNNKPVILKLCYDKISFANERQALQYFDGNGMVQLIVDNEMHNALLLQQAIPGITLTSLYPVQMEYVMDSYVNTMKKLHSKRLSNKNNFNHIRDWLQSIDKLTEKYCSYSLLNKTLNLKNELLATITAEILLHGDLHHDNILQHDDKWLAIDPKGVVGEAEFEIAAFDFMYVNEMAQTNNIKNILENRIDLLAKKSKLNSKRIKDWVFIRLMLMAAWQIEDNAKPDNAIKLAIALID